MKHYPWDPRFYGNANKVLGNKLAQFDDTSWVLLEQGLMAGRAVNDYCLVLQLGENRAVPVFS